MTASLVLPISEGPVVSPGDLLEVAFPAVQMINRLGKNVRLVEGDVILLISSSLYRSQNYSSDLVDRKFTGWVCQPGPRFDVVCMFVFTCEILTGIFARDDLKVIFRRL